MNTQFKRGILEICVLAFINSKDMYGYEIVHSISETIEVNEGTIYPILRRLQNEGDFETYILESNEGPARKYYRITPSGKDHLRSLVGEWFEFIQGVNSIFEKCNIREGILHD